MRIPRAGNSVWLKLVWEKELRIKKSRLIKKKNYTMIIKQFNIPITQLKVKKRRKRVTAATDLTGSPEDCDSRRGKL